MKKSFSIIEVIFVLAIVGVIITIAIPKINNSLNNSHISNIKNDIMMIREALIQYKNKNILKNNATFLDSLDENDNQLFSKILTYSIATSNSNKIGTWSKITNSTYKVFLDNDNYVEFDYNKENYSFNCDENEPICQELIQ